MKTLLKLTTSIFGENGASTRLADAFVQRWLASHPAGIIIERDLAIDPVPHLTGEAFAGFTAQAGGLNVKQRAAVETSDALISELKRADVIVLGLPMYNFGVPSTLKAYFDYVGRAGLTFYYTEQGPEGLLKGKKAYVFATRGGVYSGPSSETETTYVRQFLSFPRHRRYRIRLRRGACDGRRVPERGDRVGGACDRSADGAVPSIEPWITRACDSRGGVCPVKTAILLARMLLGLIFTVFGLNGFLQFLSMPPRVANTYAFFPLRRPWGPFSV